MDYLEYEKQKIEEKIKEAEVLLLDPQMKDLAEEELKRLREDRVLLDQPQQNQQETNDTTVDPMDQKNSIVEVRGAAGGEEAKLWGQDLLRMYAKYAVSKKWSVELLNESSIKIDGRGVFGKLKYEAGVHRVQRVPVTESSGRIHTSTATIVVLPELEDVEFHINPDDIDFEAFRSGGHGGQNVNKVSTAVRLKHRPSGIIVSCQTQRYQHQNREIALEMLRAKLWEIEEEKRVSALTLARRNQIGRGMRSEKIRTYNFLQDRITDHRLGKSWHNIEERVEGAIEDIITDVCTYFHEAEKEQNAQMPNAE